MAFILGELPGQIYRDGEILGRQVAGFLVMDPPGRGRGERLDGVRLMGHEDRLDPAHLAGQEQDDDLPPPVGEGAAARQPAAVDDIDEFVRFLHLHQDVAALQQLRRWCHPGQQLGLAAPQQGEDFRPGQGGFGKIERQRSRT